MRILHIIDHMDIGGAQSIIVGLFNHQSANNNLYLVSLRPGVLSKDITNSRTTTSLQFSKLSIIKPLLYLKCFIKKEDITVLHCHLLKAQLLGWLLKLLWYKDIKLVFHEHGQVFLKKYYYYIFIKLAAKKINLIIAVSRATKKALIDILSFDSKRIIIIYNFINPATLKDANDIKLSNNSLNNIFTIGFVGRLNNTKGIEILINSLPLLTFNYILLIIGDGPQKSYLKGLVQKYHVADKVTFCGFQNDVAKYYKMLSVLVVPSISEAFGLTAVEAQALGVPVVASNITGLAEVINDGVNGLLFKVGNPNDLANAVNKIYYNPKLRDHLVINAKVSSSKYSIVNFYNELCKVYAAI